MAGGLRTTMRRALALPPQVLLRKVARVVARNSRQKLGRVRDRVLGTSISSAQLFAALGGRFASPAAIAAHFRSRSDPRFFVSAKQRGLLGPQIAAALDPSVVAATLRQANDVMAHRFDLLGSGPIELGQKIDWHADFKSGHRWPPQAYYADCRYAPCPGGYDIKVPWELSRLQHLVWLGQAWWLTDDEAYVREFVTQTSDWIDSNPPRRGVNWTCTMDVAIRAANLVWAYELVRESPSLDDAFHVRLITTFLAHGRHIAANLDWSPELTSNHYLSNIAGLVYLGVYLPELTEGRKWLHFGLRELESELRKQVYDDGADFESSTSYHRLVLELFFSPALLARASGHYLSAAFWQRLERMFEFTLYLNKPGGGMPQLGDNDNGRLHRLQAWSQPEREWTDHRYLLAIGAVLFDRADFAHAAADQWAEAIWLFGPEAITKQRHASPTREPAQLASRAFADAGIYVLRHGSNYLVASVRQPGQNGVGGHSHQDLLSFELASGSGDWIVDSGTYLYTADYGARNAFRATQAHNTLCIDGAEQNRLPVDHLFHTTFDAHPRVVRWHSTDKFDLLIAEHDGYARLPGGVIHRRTFLFDKQQAAWLIVDELRGAGEHSAVGSLHLAAGVQAEIVSPGEVLLYGSNAGVGDKAGSLRIFSSDATFRLEEAQLSPSFGVRVPGQVLRFSVTVDLQRSVTVRLSLGLFVEPAANARQDLQSNAANRLAELEKALMKLSE